MRRFAAFVLALLVMGKMAAAAPPDASALEAFPCPGADKAAPETAARVTCGFLTVPSNHAAPDGRSFKLAVAIIRPETRSIETPLIVLHGGPGGHLVPFAVDAARRQLYRGRDVILFDQRGAGLSEPGFCKGLARQLVETLAKGLPAVAERAALNGQERACRDDLAAQGIDLTQVNTAATVRDMEAIRAALKIGKWDVYGVSYGTTVGLAYLKDFEPAVRAAILDSVYPPGRPAFSRTIPNFMRAFAALSEACKSAPDCARRFPDLEALLDEAVLALEKEPLDLGPIQAEIAGETVAIPNFRMAAGTFLTILHQAMYDRAVHPAIPMLLELVRRRDAASLRNLLPLFASRADSVNGGVLAAVECFERAPFDPPLAMESAAAPWPVLARNWTIITRVSDLCQTWGFAAEDRMQMPGEVSVPVLVGGGGWDPITPVSDSERTAAALGPMAQFVRVPQGGHGVLSGNACVNRIAREFLDDPSKPVDASCVAGLPPSQMIAGAALYPALAPLLQAALEQRFETAHIVLAAALVLLVSFLVWPAIWLVRWARGRVSIATIAGRSGFYLGIAALCLLVWAGLFIWQIKLGLDGPQVLLAFGLPPDGPGIEYFYAAMAAGALGLAAGLREVAGGHAHWLAILHKLTVLGAGVPFVWQVRALGLLAPGVL